MLRRLKVEHESWPLHTPFRISRGVRTAAEVIVVQIEQNGVVGRGESLPYARYGETIESVMAQIDAMADAIGRGLTREALQHSMPAGAGRNALDCALWDLAAGLEGRAVTVQLGQSALPSVVTALTVGLDAPQAMRAAAQALRDVPLIKVKVDAGDPEAQLRAVREGAPRARMIVDPNESWNIELLRAMQPVLVELGVELVEQPLPEKADEVLEGFTPLRPVCADESCHTVADLPRLVRRYQAINIKLDKTGGLTGALQLLEQARAEGLQIMCGCMISTSLSMAPAFHVARHAAFVDLDGPLWLKRDRDGGVRLHNNRLEPPRAGFWGGEG